MQLEVRALKAKSDETLKGDMETYLIFTGSTNVVSDFGVIRIEVTFPDPVKLIIGVFVCGEMKAPCNYSWRTFRLIRLTKIPAFMVEISVTLTTYPTVIINGFSGVAVWSAVRTLPDGDICRSGVPDRK